MQKDQHQTKVPMPQAKPTNTNPVNPKPTVALGEKPTTTPSTVKQDDQAQKLKAMLVEMDNPFAKLSAPSA